VSASSTRPRSSQSTDRNRSGRTRCDPDVTIRRIARGAARVATRVRQTPSTTRTGRRAPRTPHADRCGLKTWRHFRVDWWWWEQRGRRVVAEKTRNTVDSFCRRAEHYYTFPNVKRNVSTGEGERARNARRAAESAGPTPTGGPARPRVRREDDLGHRSLSVTIASRYCGIDVPSICVARTPRSVRH